MESTQKEASDMHKSIFGDSDDSDDDDIVIQPSIVAKKDAPIYDSDDVFDSDDEDTKPKVTGRLHQQHNKVNLKKRTREETRANNDSGDEYDSDGPVARTAVDDAFIDDDDDNADIMKEYEQDNQDFDDERPHDHKKMRRYDGDDDRSNKVTDDNPLTLVLSSMKKKKTVIAKEEDKENLAQELLVKMDQAAKEDDASYKAGQPGLKKLSLVKYVERTVGMKELQSTLLEHNLLAAFNAWIEPKSKSELPSLTVRNAVYDMLRKLPCETDHLKLSEIGKTVMTLLKHKMETTENKLKLRSLVEKWSRPIFNKQVYERSANRGTDVSTGSAEGGANGTEVGAVSAPRVPPILARSASNVSSASNGSFNGPSPRSMLQGSNRNSVGGMSLGEFDVALRSSSSAKESGRNRVRVPTSNGFMFLNNPESKVDKATVQRLKDEAASLRASTSMKSKIDRAMKVNKGSGKKSEFRIVTATLSARDKV